MEYEGTEGQDRENYYIGPLEQNQPQGTDYTLLPDQYAWITVPGEDDDPDISVHVKHQAGEGVVVDVYPRGKEGQDGLLATIGIHFADARDRIDWLEEEVEEVITPAGPVHVGDAIQIRVAGLGVGQSSGGRVTRFKNGDIWFYHVYYKKEMVCKPGQVVQIGEWRGDDSGQHPMPIL